MKDSFLMQIRDDIKQIAKTMSSILELDVDIADNTLTRIAGTGKFSVNIDKLFVNEGNAFKEVLRTSKSLFIKDSSTSNICKHCSNLEICKEQCELCYPILLKDEVIGIISISSSTLEQKERIIMNLNNYRNFLKNIAEFISNKVHDFINYEETITILDLLHKLLNLINDGVIIFDIHDNIIYINQKTELLFGNSLQQINYLHKINQFKFRKSLKDDHLELTIKIKGKMLKLNGKIYPIGVETRANKVFIFQDIELSNQKLIENNAIEKSASDYLIGTSDSLIKVREQCNILSVNKNNILIYGETGTGKEVFARLIHRNSIQNNKPFTSITCTGATESSLEMDMFGKGENENNVEKILFVDEGTVFIDEISDLPIRLQGKLMNLIYRGNLKCRIIVTTNKNLKVLVNKGEFRENLFYALETFTLSIPSLRNRKEDIVPMTNNFVKKYNFMEGKDIELNKSVYDAFLSYSWPGNIRELSNVVSYIITFCNSKNKVGLQDLPSGLVNKLSNPSGSNYNLEENEKRLILEALNSYGSSPYSKQQVAKDLGISKATLYRKLNKYNINENSTFDFNK